MDHTRSLSTRSRWVALGLLIPVLVAGLAGPAAAQAKPEGEMRWALYVTLAPVWLDPAEVQGQITPFWVMYAIHDALVKPMLMLINPYPWSAPLEEVRLKAR